MSLFENDLSLPGVSTEIISDYDSGYDTSLFGTTESVLIIGTAFNGPVGKPVEIYSPEHAAYVFGASYNSKTKKEATLVANIQDAWDRGCRTIYGARISGQPIYKDYQLASDTDLKLRVMGMFPSNANKDVYMVFNNEAYEMSIKVYKPANRATMAEKSAGAVDSADSILVNTIDLYSGGLTKEDDLVDLIKRVNEFSFNNVIRLAIIDSEGNDVTHSSIDAKEIKIGDMFPGLYTIGRDANVTGVLADTQLALVFGEIPYEGYEDEFYKKLSLNTNVGNDLPVYSEKGNLHELLGISAISQYDFLEVEGKIDSVFKKNSTDYEEVGLSDFELYKKLGAGYAINAQVFVEDVLDAARQSVVQKAKVKEVTNKAIKKTAIADGMYSMLQNVNAKYRVLCGANADTVIKGRLPKAKDFKVASENSIKLMNDAISVNCKIKSTDLTKEKEYEIIFKELTSDEESRLDEVKEKLLTSKTVREATAISYEDMKKDKNTYAEGSLFLVSGVNESIYSEPLTLLYAFINGKFTCLHEFGAKTRVGVEHGTLILADGALYSATKTESNKVNATLTINTFEHAENSAVQQDEEDKEFIIVSLANGSFAIAELEDTVIQVADPLQSGSTKNKNILATKILGTVEQVLSEKEDKLLVALSSTYNKNKIVIKSNQFDFLTIDEVVELLNEDKDVKKLLEFKTVDIVKAQEYISELLDSGEIKSEFKDKKLVYDVNKLIPFRTDDNFARQLAQHCTYTSLKTAPTHGIMGTKILLDTNLEPIANRVNELVGLGLDSTLVAKKGNGTDMLDKNNMPYPIGRKVSVVVGQYYITTDDGYTCISNGAAGYAGMVSCLPLDQSSTLQSISIPIPMYELTNYQLSSLTNAGFVTFKNSYSKGWVVTDGVTMAPSGSQYRRLSASRIADGIEELIRSVCEPFIGKQNNLTNQNSLRSAIKSKLDTITGTLIETYDFRLILDKASTKLGIINIDYAIIPIYEIKEIRNKITVSDN